MRNRFIAALLAAAAATAAVPGAALAGSLSVDPIRLEITQGRRTATLRVRNQEQAPVTIRAYALAWSQVDGEDRYEDSSAVIVSPPIFTIPAGGTQLIRVGLRSPSANARAYRLMVEEVPQARPGGGVQVALRLNLPLFAMMNAGTAAELGWAASRGADGRWTVEAVNNGANYVRVEPAAAEAATGVDFDNSANLGVVLPGSRRRWVVGNEPALLDRSRFTAIQRVAARAQPPAVRGN
ncbi:MAG TPA: fimbria/pilus periplasmic chaperone [Allosphingosinicella sp.]|jgi:fimbrial chaperone protein|nr:fimbria/pilus periplasmic chaperone [Allosphingosinicella sp.]